MADKLTSLTGFGEGDPKPEKMDKQKRWGNSAIKGFGVNSPAMMKARAGFEKSAKAKALSAKMGKTHPVSGHSQWLTQQVKKDNPAYYAKERRALRARRKDA